MQWGFNRVVGDKMCTLCDVKRRLECVDDKSICSITNCMDILETAHDFWREGKM